MIQSELKLSVIRQIIRELRSDGPCSIEHLRYSVFEQVTGITIENLDEIFKAAWKIVTSKKYPMVEEYGIKGSFLVHPSMYDEKGNYKGG